MLRFNDGMDFDTSGKLHVEKRSDGYYVVGQGMLIPVDSRAEGLEEIARMSPRQDKIREASQTT